MTNIEETEELLKKVVNEYEKSGGVLTTPFKWVKVDISTFLPPDATALHVNMKHFVAMYSNEPIKRYDVEDDSGYNHKFNELFDMISSKSGINEKYLIDDNKLMGFIFGMREMRKLHEVISDNFGKTISKWYIDNLRFFRYKDKFIVTDDCVPIDWKSLTKYSLGNVGTN